MDDKLIIKKAVYYEKENIELKLRFTLNDEIQDFILYVDTKRNIVTGMQKDMIDLGRWKDLSHKKIIDLDEGDD